MMDPSAGLESESESVLVSLLVSGIEAEAGS